MSQNKILDVTFTGPKTAGVAGSSTGFGAVVATGPANPLTDLFGNVYSVNSANKLVGTTSSGTYQWDCDVALFDASLNGRDRRTVLYVDGSDWSSSTTLTYFLLFRGINLGKNNESGYVLSMVGGNSGSISLYSMAGNVGAAVPTPLGNKASVSIPAISPTKKYAIDAYVCGNNPTYVSMSLWDVTSADIDNGAILLGTNKQIDYTAALQITNGEFGFSITSPGGQVIRRVASYSQSPAYNVVFHGDSLTFGVGSTSGQGTVTGTTYPSIVADNLGPQWTATNYGHSGHQISDFITEGAAVDAMIVPGMTNVLCIEGGSNDMGIGSQTADQTYARLKTYCASRKLAGWTVVFITPTPASPSIYPVNFTKLYRDPYVALVLSNWQTDGLIDAVANTSIDYRIGQQGCEYSNYFCGDVLHLSDAGYAVVADYATAAIATALNKKTSQTTNTNTNSNNINHGGFINNEKHGNASTGRK